MEPEPTIPTSWDYFVELNDDAKQTPQAEPEMIILPPASPGAPPSANGPEQQPQR